VVQQLVLHEAREVGHVFDMYPQHVIHVAGHCVACHHLGPGLHGRAEQFRVRRAGTPRRAAVAARAHGRSTALFQPNIDVREQRQPEPLRIEQGNVTANHPAHRSKDVLLYRQGDINFIVNREPKSAAGYFAAEHGPSACGMAFRVKDSHKAYERALALGAQPIEIPTGPMELRLPAIKGIGGVPIYLIDRFEDGKSIYDIDFEFIAGVERRPAGHGLKLIDHLTHNVYRGRMAFWADFYERLFNFREIRYFDIEGEYTGLFSKAHDQRRTA
jgi:4-hydroxyphenylpyruvate dioxygenase